jgi:hypothetical protein
MVTAQVLPNGPDASHPSFGATQAAWRHRAVAEPHPSRRVTQTVRRPHRAYSPASPRPSRSSRSFLRSASGANGFCKKPIPESSTPWFTTVVPV